MTDTLTKRIIVALRNGPVSYRELQEKFDYDPGLDEALIALSDTGEARRFTNWTFPWSTERVEYWTLAKQPAKAGA